jgi:hypothetical protein
VKTPCDWPARPRGLSRLAGVSAMALVLAACVVGLSACGNMIPEVTDAGQLGLTVDATGRPVIAVFTCAKTTAAVDMFEGRAASDPDNKENVARGDWQARRAFAGVQKLAIMAPGDSWKPTSGAGQLEPGKLFVLEGRTLEVDYSSLGGTSFRTRDLAKLTPDQVAVNGKSMSWSAFAAYKCR